MTPDERVGLARHEGHRLCTRCGKAAIRAETALATRAPQRKREEVLEEWDLMRSDGVTDLTVAAKRMGMTRAGLQKALERARAAGDPRAITHGNSQLGGLTPQRVAPRRMRRAA
jgi:predicted DNA-binding protein (UPF0251 family)